MQVYPSTPDYYSEEEESETETRDFSGTYAEYNYRCVECPDCSTGSTDYLWGASDSSGEDPVDVALRLDEKACYTNYECFDDAEGYYYDDHSLKCGFPVARAWPDAYN